MNTFDLSTFHAFKEQLHEIGISESELNDSHFNSSLCFLQEYGLPLPKHEEWKYFPLTKIVQKKYVQEFKVSKTFQASSFAPYFPDAIHIIMVNGYPINLNDISSIPGLEINIQKRKNAVIDDPTKNPFPHLNRVVSFKEVCLRFTEEYKSDIPVHILHIISNETESPILVSPTISINLQSNAKALIIETFHADDVQDSLINSSVTKVAEQGSTLHHVIIEQDLGTIAQVYNCHSSVYSHAIVQDHVIVSDSNTVRNTITGSLLDKQATYNIYGVVSGDKKSLIDNHTIVDHIAPHCESNELFKHVLSDNSTAVFNGKIYVQKDAQKTNAYQSNRTLLLSPTATINTKPQLEIFADDVKCSHGATTGSVDEEALNYLRSRGISRSVALNLLTEAFIGEVIQYLSYEPLKDHFEGNALLKNKGQ